MPTHCVVSPSFASNFFSAFGTLHIEGQLLSRCCEQGQRWGCLVSHERRRHSAAKADGDVLAGLSEDGRVLAMLSGSPRRSSSSAFCMGDQPRGQSWPFRLRLELTGRRKQFLEIDRVLCLAISLANKLDFLLCAESLQEICERQSSRLLARAVEDKGQEAFQRNTL